MKDLIKRLFKETTIPGYNKSNLTFFKRKNNFTYIINIQPSRNNIKGEEYFTINIGVYCPEIHQLIWEKVSKIPVETECTFRTRVNYFLNSKKDFWLELSNDNEVFYKNF